MLAWRPSVRLAERSYVLPSGHILDLDSVHEPWLDPIFETCLEGKSGAFVDVGANQGQTLAKMLRIAPDNRYIGFEPQPGCAFYLDEFFRLNGLSNCSIIPIALSDRPALIELSLHGPNPGDRFASTAKAFRPDSFYVGSKLIPAFRGDDVMPDEPIAVIKIDVEGAELEVLKGLKNTLAKHRPFVVFEVLNNYLRTGKQSLSEELTAYRNKRAKQISAYFERAGYKVFNIRGSNLIPVDVIEPEVSDDKTITDYLAVPT